MIPYAFFLDNKIININLNKSYRGIIRSNMNFNTGSTMKNNEMNAQ